MPPLVTLSRYAESWLNDDVKTNILGLKTARIPVEGRAVLPFGDFSLTLEDA